MRDLSTTLFTRRGEMKAVDGLSLSVGAGETVALVGESGCGKSLSALSIMRLLPDPPARIVGGTVKLNGRDIVAASEETMLDIRGKEIGMIFQDPISSLNPVATIEKQIAEVLTTHTELGRGQARARAHELLELVGMPDAGRRLDAYPHQLSGGMCQRVVIAMAIACSPSVLIADEPTTALDVTVQAQVLALLKKLQADAGMAMIFITHDLGVVAETADRVVVMYAGRKVEEASVDDLFESPLHPYTVGLIGATPIPGAARAERLADIPGMVPPLNALPPGLRLRAALPARDGALPARETCASPSRRPAAWSPASPPRKAEHGAARPARRPCPLQHGGRRRARRERRQPRACRGRDAGAGGRIGLRQVDARQGDPEAGAGRGRRDRGRRRRHRAARPRSSWPRCAARCR